MFDDFTPEEYAMWLKEERVRANSGREGLERYLRGMAVYWKARAGVYHKIARAAVDMTGASGAEVRAYVASALQDELEEDLAALE